MKAKDQYGSVIAIVEKQRRELAQEGITDMHHNENGGFVSNKDGMAADGSVKSSGDTSLALFT